MISQSQAKAINLLWSSYKECSEINSELTVQSEGYRELIDGYEFQLEKYRELSEVQNERIAERDLLLTSYKKNEKISSRKIRWLKTTRAAIGILFTASLAYISYDSIKK